MSCPVSLAFGRDCSDSIGGLSTILISERDNISAFTETNHEITAITQVAATNFYQYDLKKEAGSLTSTSTIDMVGGTSFYENVLAFTINKMTAAKSNELKLMILGRLAVLVKDNNEQCWALGFSGSNDDNGFAEGSSLIGQTGQAFGDPNQYQIEIMDKQKYSPYAVDSTVISGLSVVTA
jgi:hypothetical protein